MAHGLGVGDLDYNRTATPWSASRLEYEGFKNAHTGFVWNSGDNATKGWRPQGLTGMKLDSKNFMIVSWYGRDGEYNSSGVEYSTIGVRISVANVTAMSNVEYRHILLLDQDGSPFSGMHAGGLVYKNGKLHVPDTRDGAKRIHVFDMESIEPMSAYGYAYTLRAFRSYNTRITPSFMSYDWMDGRFLIGKFVKEDPHVFGLPPIVMEPRYKSARLSWYSSSGQAATAPFHGYFFGQMQGAQSEGNTLWIASSWGKGNSSHLHVGCYDSATRLGDIKTGFRGFFYPPGLEDLHRSKTSDNLWMHTEFGSREGTGNDRVVFATKVSKLKPYTQCN